MKRLLLLFLDWVRFILEPDYMIPKRTTDAPPPWSEEHEYD